jgi:hypothetical protein
LIVPLIQSADYGQLADAQALVPRRAQIISYANRGQF